LNVRFSTEMGKRSNIVLLLVLGYCGNLLSQQLSHQVLVPGAGVIFTGSVSYSQTVGETAVEIVSSPGFVFTQGFQQPGIKVMFETPPPGNGVKVFPNPASDLIKVELFGEFARSFRIELVNITGTIVRSEKIAFNGQFWHIKELPVGDLLNGLYFVRVMSDDMLINRIFKIEKF
jgi:hypothetical protein